MSKELGCHSLLDLQTSIAWRVIQSLLGPIPILLSLSNFSRDVTGMDSMEGFEGHFDMLQFGKKPAHWIALHLHLPGVLDQREVVFSTCPLIQEFKKGGTVLGRRTQPNHHCTMVRDTTGQERRIGSRPCLK
ncbi:hypothetical protein OIU77_015098 [Salix suchowensis]|uniref:Uncharacterized protein n=1 Tax=Salix suchowensis TaxID=1278906 RepID=A0ABQ8ZSB2_9ROSI|nr:hypothetical protein OIU77_015098 [Salix suchowensis]